MAQISKEGRITAQWVLDLQVNFDDALAVSFCLSHLLPIDAEMKQQLLEMTSPGERLAELNEIVDRFQG